ncbi:MAG: reprolysin-like metallopeptidase [Flavicella sp.]
MKLKLTLFTVIFCIFGGTQQLASQVKLWDAKSDTATLLFKKKTRKETPSQKKIFQLNSTLLEQKLNKLQEKKMSKGSETITLSFPDAYGNISDYSVKETSILSPTLQKKFPNIRSFSGVSLENPQITIKFSTSRLGIHVIKFLPNHQLEYIDPYTQNGGYYTAYSKNSIPNKTNDWSCGFEQKKQHNKTYKKTKTTTSASLKTFRLALSCTWDYAQYHIVEQNIEETSNELTKKEAVLSAMNVTITRVNGIFEKDMAITFQLVDNNESLIFLNADTDPYSGDEFDQLDQVQETCDTKIGYSNYDIGHLFRVGDAGIAELSGACTSVKAMGITGTNPPIGDSFDVDYVAHEIGHQLGATHTFNNSCNENRTSYSAIEPGSGSTIMAYAGICYPNVQYNSDSYFHSISITQIQANTTSGASTCADETQLEKEVITASAGEDKIIPINTPFVLEGTATGNLDNATYCWEQTDAGIAVMPPSGTSTTGPLFRSVSPTDKKYRYFPNIETILLNETGNQWEQLPQTTRTLNYNFTVRNNENPISQTKIATLKLTTTESAGPFLVTSQSSSEIIYAGENKSITWEVANTDTSPINESHVHIYLSLDGGYTYPITLAENVPNDGQQDVFIPDVESEQARIKVAAANNVFFNVNASDLEIITTDFILSPESTLVSSCNSDSEVFEVNYKTFNNYNGTTFFSIENLPEGINASIEPEFANSDTTFTITLSGIDNIAKGKYNLSLKGTGTTTSYETDLELLSNDLIIHSPSLTCPVNKAQAQNTSIIFKWNSNPNISNYLIEIATDPNFLSIVDSTNTSKNEHTSDSLEEETTYYWRVTGSNACENSTSSLVFNFTTGTTETLKYSANNLSLAIPDNDNSGMSSTIEVPENLEITNLKVMVDISHSFVGDLEILLTHPENETIRLTEATGYEGQNLNNILFDDKATRAFLSATAPFSGAYRPAEPLITFDKLSSAGTWTLTIADKASEDIGFLNAWELQFDAIPNNEQTCAIPPKAFTPNGDGFNDVWNLSNIRIDNDYNTYIYPYVNLKIYTPLGELVYSKDKYNNTFDGRKNNGTKLKTGPYIYHIESNETDFQRLTGWIYIKY